jgi:preprotein translocase subunit SecY
MKLAQDCWDCPLPFSGAMVLVIMIILCVALSIWLRRKRKYGIGNGILFFAAFLNWHINHAGRNWGIIRWDDPKDCYDRNVVSAFCVILAIAAATIIVFFHRRFQKKAPVSQ